MKKIQVDREQYDTLVKFGRPWTTTRRTRSRALDEPIRVTDADGEIVETRRVEIGCGIREGEARLIECKAKKDRNARPAVTVVATKVEEVEPGKWDVTFERESVTELQPVMFMAPVTGHTANRTKSIDPDAPTLGTATQQLAVIEETKLSQKARRQRRLQKIKAELAELETEPSTSTERKHLKEIAFHTDKLAKLSDVA